MTGSYAREVGRRLRAARNARGLSLGEVNAASGGRWKDARTGSWERGDKNARADDIAGYALWLTGNARIAWPGDPAGDAAMAHLAARAAFRAVKDLLEPLSGPVAIEALALVITALGCLEGEQEGREVA